MVDSGLVTYVATCNGELFELVVTLIWLYLGLEPGLTFQRLGLGTCWTRYKSPL